MKLSESSSKARKNVNQLNIIKQKDQDDSNQKQFTYYFTQAQVN